MNNVALAKKIIEEIWYITIATASKNSIPWNSPVYFAYDEDYNFYAGGITQFSLGPHSGTGNPGFSNPAAGDFHLAAGSPAVDSGVDAGYTADLEGRNVPGDGNADGIAVADRGAFESN